MNHQLVDRLALCLVPAPPFQAKRSPPRQIQALAPKPTWRQLRDHCKQPHLGLALGVAGEEGLVKVGPKVRQFYLSNLSHVIKYSHHFCQTIAQILPPTPPPIPNPTPRMKMLQPADELDYRCTFGACPQSKHRTKMLREHRRPPTGSLLPTLVALILRPS